MTLNDLLNAREFLQRVFVGRGDEERLVKTIESLDREISRRERSNGKQ